ncbi:PAS domain S-box protein [Coleofasciculus sp. H7-2]|uniref:PAS domain S-box protein n=1 Tax=Coleofasciculus sp. H7-2 TaxID=3351545 RepID=UPI00366AE185
MLTHDSDKLKKKSVNGYKSAEAGFFNLSLELLCIAGLDGYFKHLNPTWEKTLGFTNKELLSQPFMEFVHPEDREATFTEVQKLATGVETISFENRYLCKDGSYKWLLWTSAVSTEEDLLYAVVRDISDRKPAEEKLRNLGAVLENAVEGISRLDTQGRYVTVNKAYANAAGYEPEEMIGMEWQRTVHPEELDKLIAAYHKMLVDGKVEAETRGIRKDGSIFYKQVVMICDYDEQQRFMGHHCFMKDITERQRTEQERSQLANHIQLLLQSTGEGIYGIDLQGRCTFINKAAAQMLGYQPDEVMGKEMHELIHHSRSDGSFYPSVECAIFCAVRKGNSCRIDNEVLWRRDGTAFAAEYSSYPILEGEEIKGAVVTFVDISDRKLAEEALKQANEALEIRVEERTAQLRHTLQQLEDEMTERQRVEEALYKEREFLNALLNNLADGIVACDANGVLTLFNRATQEFHGLPEQALPADRWAEHFDLYLPDGKTLMKTEDIPLFRAFWGETVREVEMIIAPKQGKIRTLLASGQAIVDAQGKKLGAVVAMHDISDRKQAEKTQARLTAILEATPDFVGTSDAQGNVLYINGAGRRMLGIEEDEDLSTKHISELSTKSAAEMMLAEGVPAAIKDGVWSGETAFQSCDGNEIPVSQVIMAHKGENGAVEFLSTIARDITPAKQAEEALRQSQARLAEAQKVAHVGSWEFDLATGEIAWSEELFRLWGMEPNQTVPSYEDLLQKVHPDDREVFAKAVELAITEGKPYEFDNRTLLPDGAIGYMFSKGQPILNSQGQVIKLCGIGLDISDRQLSEEQLRQTTSELKAVFQAFPDLYFRLNSDGTILDYNAGQIGTGNLYIPPEVFLGKRMQDILPPHIGHQFDEGILQVLQKNSLGAHSPASVHLEYSLPSENEDKSYEARLVPLLENQIMVIVRDITQRQQAEEALRQSEAQFRQLAQREELLNQLANLLRNSLDVNTILETAVEETRSLLQIDRCLFVWYRPFAEEPAWDVVKEAKIPALPSFLGHYPAPENSVTQKFINREMLRVDDLTTATDSGEQELYMGSGYTAILALPIQTPSGEIGLLICGHHRGSRLWSDDEVELLQAVTDQLAIALFQAELYAQSQDSAQQAQQKAQQLQQTLHQLQQTQAQLIQSEKMSGLGQMVAGVAHEINNPVNFIHGNLTHANVYTQDLLNLLRLYQQHYPHPVPEIQDETEAIDLDFLVEDLPKILGSMKMGTDRICQIVLSLRNFSRLDEAEMKEVDIHEGIDNTLLILQNRLKAKPDSPGIQIVKEYGNLPLVECYAGQMNQVFMNLLNNAFDALETQPLPRIVTIRSQVVNSHVAIRIADNGSGMTEQVKARLFDPFFTTKPVGKGTGLGLSISYQIVVEKHGGILKCVSKPGQGAEFWIEIPICQGLT